MLPECMWTLGKEVPYNGPHWFLLKSHFQMELDSSVQSKPACQQLHWACRFLGSEFPQKDIPRDEKRNPRLGYFITGSHLALRFPVLLECDVLLCFKIKLQCVIGRVRAILYYLSPQNL